MRVFQKQPLIYLGTKQVTAFINESLNNLPNTFVQKPFNHSGTKLSTLALFKTTLFGGVNSNLFIELFYETSFIQMGCISETDQAIIAF